MHVSLLSRSKQSEVDHEDAEEEGEGYGLELGRLAKAQSECQMADLASGKMWRPQKAAAGQLLEKIQTRYNERREENEKIYMEGVVQPDAPVHQAQTMAKIVVPVELMGADRSARTVPGVSRGRTPSSSTYSSMVPAEALKAGMRYQRTRRYRAQVGEAAAATTAVQEQLAKIGAGRRGIQGRGARTR